MGYDCSINGKRNGCNYCYNNKTIKERFEPSTQISIEDKHLVSIDIFGMIGIPINYCPLCGKKLRKILL